MDKLAETIVGYLHKKGRLEIDGKNVVRMYNMYCMKQFGDVETNPDQTFLEGFASWLSKQVMFILD